MRTKIVDSQGQGSVLFTHELCTRVWNQDVNQSFGRLILQARKKKGYTQRQLAASIEVDFTYLSKLENDRAEYPPSEKVIRSLADNLDLPAEELLYLAGRITQRDSEAFEELVKRNYKEMPAMFRRLRENPEIESLLRARDEQVARLQRENKDLKAKLSEVEAKLEEERIATQEKLARLNEAQKKLSDAFKGLSEDTLENND